MEPSRADFCHPYTPYGIQLQFMAALYHCIENGQVGIFESPTGTGKSLSLICGALTWLRDHKRRSVDASAQVPDRDDTPHWLVQAERKERMREMFQHRQDLDLKLASVRREEAKRERSKASATSSTKRLRLDEIASAALENTEDEQFVLAEYESDGDRNKGAPVSGSGYSADTQALLDKLKGAPATKGEDQETDESKVVFCSRTHSQLTQLVNELRRVIPPSSIASDPSGDEKEDVPEEVVKHLSLGSRKHLCINPKVSSLSSTSAINERCLELQKPDTAKEHKCSFLPGRNSKDSVETFRNRALAHIQDIEHLGKLVQKLKICPYYASRSAIAPSEIVTLPYPLLLQKSAREALGISLKNNVIIIDEAHNLMDAITGLFSVSLHLNQLERATSQVTTYVQRFKNRLKGKNRVYVAQVIRLLNSITNCLSQIASKSKQGETEVSPIQLMAGKGVDQIRPHKLIQYLQDSKLAYKVEAYAESNKEAQTAKGSGILMHLQNFLLVLMNPAAEGRFFVTHQNQEISVRYTLLDPREHFREIVEEARSVILAGGTMSPISDYADYLFSYLSPDRLKTFTFGHVIPPSNLFVQTIGRGPTGTAFEFTFENRKSDAMISELGGLLERICRTVPDGVVVFFPSYDYISQVTTAWKRGGNVASVFATLARWKPIFEETRGTAADELLRDYTQAIDTGKGGLMLSVVGGKLSEGINFSDKLGRAVIAVGLPFPNINGAEWKAKIEHVEKTRYNQLRAQGGRPETEYKDRAKAAGRDFYENACMRAVNQCIGRAIRHKDDYAAILLVDKRFASDRIEKKLPQWILKSMDGKGTTKSWVDTEMGLRAFFAGKH